MASLRGGCEVGPDATFGSTSELRCPSSACAHIEASDRGASCTGRSAGARAGSRAGGRAGGRVKYLPLIWFGIWRKPARAVLVFLQVTVAFALFGVLQGLKTGVEQAISATRADLLLVFSRVSMGDPLPLSTLDQIRSIPGVRVAIPVDLLGGTYQKPTQEVFMVAISPLPDWTAAFTFDIAPPALEAFRSSRTAALASEAIASRYGWKIGDRIPLESPIARLDGSAVWTFDLVGLFRDSDLGGGSEKILIQFPYLDAARLTRKGTMNHVNVAVTDPAMAVAVADEIDHLFANSANETRTQSLRELAQLNLQSIGDLNFLIRTVVAAVLVALLFAIATMMMQSLRERTPELAVLKTLGFTNGAVFMLILTEAAFTCATAAVCGLALATVAFPLASKFVPGLTMPPIVVIVGTALAVAVGLISAAVPAMQAARIDIAAALAQR
jgi:putative ABC transport system permease protein